MTLSCPSRLERSSTQPAPLSAFWRRLPLPLLEAALVVAWSSGTIGIRYSIDYAPPFLVVFWRCVLVVFLLLPPALPALRRASPALLLRHAGIGLLAMGGFLAGLTGGIERGVPAGLGGLIAGMLPVGTALLSILLLRHWPNRRTWAGLAVGLGGVLLVTHDALALGEAPLWAYGLPLLGMLSLALSTLWQKHGHQEGTLDLLPGLWLQCAVSTPVFALLAGLEGGLAPVATAGFAVAVIWTACLSTIGGYGLYWLCLRRATPTRVASVLYLSPAVTFAWAWAMFGEPFTWPMLLGTAVSAVGIWIVIRGEAADMPQPATSSARPPGQAHPLETSPVRPPDADVP